MCNRKAERINCNEHILHVAIYCNRKAHSTLYAINQRVSEAEKEWEIMSTQLPPDSTGSEAAFHSRRLAISPGLLGNHPEQANFLPNTRTNSPQKQQTQSGLQCAVIMAQSKLYAEYQNRPQQQTKTSKKSGCNLQQSPLNHRSENGGTAVLLHEQKSLSHLAFYRAVTRHLI